ncbi:MAG: VpsF family polysaccharide biosynthesis protein [Acidiphilium sp.]|nr:VpsF family polysaccharide biosynthesis protein [Acidiphilium sp.]
MTSPESRALRPLIPSRLPPYAPPVAPRLSVALAMLSLAMQLTISANLLMIMGIHYDIAGGSPIVKINPATYVAVLALAIRLFEGGDPFGTLMRLFAANRLIATFVIAFISCIAYSLITIGVTGSAALIDSYLSAGILLLVLCDISIAERRVLGAIMLSLYMLNVVIAITESLTRHLLIGLYIGTYQYKAPFQVFRGVALYDHPLTGAMMTSMAIFLLLQMRLRPLFTTVLLSLSLVGLFAFGGRAALVATVAALLVLGAWFLALDLLNRRLTALKLAAILGGLVLSFALAWFVITQTSIADRIVSQDYVDTSAKVREIQFLVPGLMDFREILLGIEVNRMPQLLSEVGLHPPFTGIENFWLVAFVNLGLIGFSVYLLGFMSLMIDLWRRSPLFGRAMLVVVIMMASTSNSLGAKSNVLFVLTGTLVACSGYAEPRRAPIAARLRPAGFARPVPPHRALTPLASLSRK